MLGTATDRSKLEKEFNFHFVNEANLVECGRCGTRFSIALSPHGLEDRRSAFCPECTGKPGDERPKSVVLNRAKLSKEYGLTFKSDELALCQHCGRRLRLWPFGRPVTRVYEADLVCECKR